MNELLQTLGINQYPIISFAPNNTVQQIKRRYHIIENENDENDLDFTCDENREQNEKQLFKRISNLQQKTSYKKSKVFFKYHIIDTKFDLSSDNGNKPINMHNQPRRF